MGARLRERYFYHNIIMMFFLFFIITNLLTTFAHSQEDVEPKMEKGVRIANLIIYPSILLGYEYNNNVFSRNALTEEIYNLAIISDNIYVVKPTFKFVLPFSNSFARLSYTPQYREFEDADKKMREDEEYENISHFLNFDTKLKFSNGTTIAAKEEYVQGILEVETFDPGGEVVFGFDPYTFNSAHISFSHEFAGIRGFEIKAIYDDLDFDEPVANRLINYETKGLKGSYYQALTSRLVFVSDYSFRNVMQFSPTINDREYDEYIFAVGVKGNLLRKTTGAANLSFTKLDIIEENVSDFSGLTGDVNLSTMLSNRYIINFLLKRYAYQSFFLDNRYYLSNLASYEISCYLKRNIILSLRGSYNLNTYYKAVDVDPGNFPLNMYIGIKREDETGRFDIGINYLFNDLTGIRMGYSHIVRESNIDLYDFDTKRFFIQLGYGWF